jgi:serine/threonine protein kinase/Tol biopolymer transport system component
VTPERWAQIEDLFHRAVEWGPEHRTALLDQTCSDDPELRREVEALLSCDGSAYDHVHALVRRTVEGFDFPLIGEIVSHYRILEGVGGGGMGLVYRAEDIKLGRLVAIKFLPEESANNPAVLSRFEREARSASALQHPNICPIYEFGEHDRQPFIVMPLLEGQNLRDMIAARGSPFSLAEILNFGLQIANGLEAAHAKGIIHRDIKPANVFITDRGEAKILDFGLAKLVSSNPETPGYGLGIDGRETGVTPQPARPAAPVERTLTRLGVAIGTAGYMSPEQVRGETLDTRTDLFSFGLVLYEMATGRRAFLGETAAMVEEGILQRQPQLARELNPKVSPKLDAVLHKCLEKERDRRYQHATDICIDFKTLENLPSAQVRMMAISATALVLLAIIGFFWTSRRAPQEFPRMKLSQLTANSSENPVDAASISPNGETLAYDDLKGIHLKTLGTNQIRDIPPPVGVPRWEWYPGPWFPDSGTLLLTGGSTSQHAFSTWKLALSEGAPHKFADGAIPWAVSPDGSLIAVTKAEGRLGPREIWLIGSTGQNAQKWLETDENSTLERMMWFPDGKRMLYNRQHQNPEAYEDFVETRLLSGGPARVVLSSPGWWSEGGTRDEYLLPDGRLIYLVTGQGINGPTCNYWQMQLDLRTGKPNGSPKQLTNWAGVCMDFTGVTADGKRLVFTKYSSEGLLYVAGLHSAGTQIDVPRRLTLNDATEVPAAWTPDSKAVFFESNVNGKLQVFRQALDQDAANPVVSTSSSPGVLLTETRALPAVTADGTWLLYPIFPPGQRTTQQTKLMRIALAGGSAELALSAPLYDTPRCTSLPTNFCVIAELSANGHELIFSGFDPTHGRGRELTRFEMGDETYSGTGEDASSNLVGWDLSPDGRRIAVFKTREEFVYLLSTTTLTVSRFAVKDWPILQLRWSSDSAGLFVSSRREDSSVLLHVDLAGTARLLWRQAGWDGLQCVPSPDGHHIAIFALRKNNNVWMMENF